ncbi:lasso peptide isopeptide bond-forming cyclase [Methanobacterium alkalithermotolerans]|uniref:Putative asparagine synthetase [glutamine-hydrolyzing] n=1 Tax=Methanobacterium alkalithermotolerans TaxID=2731220 RepID=A0A8T8K3Z5_9EURY|nr:lasso peptide isopeptide bond-forming cyclase [Methanobacterium alkalithermotolerans]QUH22612.1 lasso peptide isopeptide bond-forming cyclase [Methanobacterium alkalithermotolerans]
MSAITGIFYRKGKKVDPHLIQKMNDKLSHRGPDGSHTWVEDNVGLGHQMLHTTPESLHEKLPFIEEDLIITADARIDNREELAKKLDIADVETVSDSYFILKAYGRWGEDCPDKLLGDFAFAIWDRKKEILFCARDHMGVKPFYYYVDEEMFVFGTEIKALFEVGGVPREKDEKRIALALMVNDFQEKERTFYKDIKSFKAAHYMAITKDSSKFKRYWKLDPDLEIRMDSDEEYMQEFLKIFTEAVNCRLRSPNKKIGVMLSGGLDSSSVTCTAQKIIEDSDLEKEIHSFSFIFDDFPESDERYYINKVLEGTNIQANFVKCDNISPLENIDKVLDYQDQPTTSFQIGLVHELNALLKSKGLNIILTGEGGDQVVSHSHNYIEELIVSFKWIKAYHTLNNISKVRKVNKYRLLKNKLIHIIQFYVMKIPTLYHILKKPFPLKDFINKPFLERMGIKEAIFFKSKKMNNITCKSEQYYLTQKVAHQNNFEVIDQYNSIFQIENRHPFYDKRVIEYCYGLPIEQKIRSGYNRYILRTIMNGFLPEEIRCRVSKANIGLASIKNLLSEKEIMNKIVTDEQNIIKEYVNLESVKDLYSYNLLEKISIFKIFAWRIILIYLWLEKVNFKTNNKLY